MSDIDFPRVTEMFLVPSSILLGILGASREPLKAGVSVFGLGIAVIWAISLWNSFPEEPSLRVWLLCLLPLMFGTCWLSAAVANVAHLSK